MREFCLFILNRINEINDKITQNSNEIAELKIKLAESYGPIKGTTSYLINQKRRKIKSLTQSLEINQEIYKRHQEYVLTNYS